MTIRRVFRPPAGGSLLRGRAIGLASVVLLVVLSSVRGGPAQSTRRGAEVGDHWHARYEIVFCGWVLSPLPGSAGGIHTHGDRVIHIHPGSPEDAGPHASLGAFFRSASARLTASSLELPGWLPMRNGDQCPDHRPGRWRLVVNGRPEPAMDRYLLQEGGEIRLEFSAE
jgi:hypothetical protein